MFGSKYCVPSLQIPVHIFDINWKGSANKFPFHLDDLGSANGFLIIIVPQMERDGN
jgi:hypothetical protein